MYLNFNELPGDARIWVYQSEKELTDAQAKEIAEKTRAFCESWTSHGDSLRASSLILYNRFIIFGVDSPSDGICGRAIDASARFIMELGGKYQTDFLNRNIVFFYDPVLKKARPMPLAQTKELIGKGEILPETPVFNTLIQRKRDLLDKWIIPAGESWLKSRFPKENAYQSANNGR